MTSENLAKFIYKYLKEKDLNIFFSGRGIEEDPHLAHGNIDNYLIGIEDEFDLLELSKAIIAKLQVEH